MSKFSKKWKKLKKGLKKVPGKLLHGEPLITGIASDIPVVGKVTDFIEKGSGIGSNALNWLGHNRPSWADDAQAWNAKLDQAAAAYFLLGAPLTDAFGQASQLEALITSIAPNSPNTSDEYGRREGDTFHFDDGGLAPGTGAARPRNADTATVLVLLAVTAAVLFVATRR